AATAGTPAGEPGSARASSRASWWRRLQGTALRPATAFAAALLIAVGAGAGYLVRNPDDAAERQIVKAQPAGGLERDVSATLVRQGDVATLHVNDLPRIDRDEVYEVWVQRAGVMEPASTFVLRRDGTADAAVPGTLEGAASVLVTREPRGGSRQPTGPPLLEAPLN
ncbi:MAG: anti-sigma factor, partial [Geminicoccales bacterium]